MNRLACVVTCIAVTAATFGRATPAFGQTGRATTPATALPPESLSVADVVARAKAAIDDHKPEVEREQWTLHAYGLDGTVDTWHKGLDQRSDTTLGPFKTSRGTTHGQHWHQNDNGETIVDKPEPSQVERPLAQTVARIHDPLDAWLLATTYASGHTQRSYYDPRTFVLLRSERTTAGHTSYIVFEDFRTDVRGRTRAWRYSGGDDRPANDYEYRLMRDDPGAIADETLAVPKDRRVLVEFPSGAEAVRLPARIVNNRIYVRLEIAGRGLDFLLDTGSSTLAIDAAVARELGLGVYGRSTQTVGGTYASGRVVVPTIGIGTLSLRDVVMRTIPLEQREKAVRVVGLLGFDFLHAVGLRIDYADGTVDAYRPGTIAPPASALPLEVSLNTGAPVVKATFGDATGEDFVVDTGAAFPYVLFQRFVRTHPTAASNLSPDALPRYLSAVGGQVEYRPIVTRRLTVGGYAFDDPDGIEALSANAFGFDNQDGLIGADILKLFVIYTDYASGKLYLGPTPQLQAMGAHLAREQLQVQGTGRRP